MNVSGGILSELGFLRLEDDKIVVYVLFFENIFDGLSHSHFVDVVLWREPGYVFPDSASKILLKENASKILLKGITEQDTAQFATGHVCIFSLIV